MGPAGNFSVLPGFKKRKEKKLDDKLQQIQYNSKVFISTTGMTFSLCELRHNNQKTIGGFKNGVSLKA